MSVDIEIDETPDQQPAVIVPVPTTVGGDLTPTVMELVERITRLEGALVQTDEALVEVEREVESVEVTAVIAQEDANLAIEIAAGAEQSAMEATELVLETADETGVLETVLEETETSVVPDIAPTKTHWMFRPMSEWRQKLGAS